MSELNEKLKCINCETEITQEESYYFNDEVYCEDCLDELTSTCECCGDRTLVEDNAGDDNIYLCGRCYNRHYTRCEECDRIIHNEDAYYLDDDSCPYYQSCYDILDEKSIHSYDYKPDPIFFGKGTRYFGIELEIDCGGKITSNAGKILSIANRIYKHMYIKSDGSLDDGLELVTHPMTLDYNVKQMPWKEILQECLALCYKSHKTSTCGLHIHVNRDSFGYGFEKQEECISRVLYFIEHHWEEMLRFSRRSEEQMNRWAARYGYKNNPKEVLETAKKFHSGRYTCVNITNYNTIEFRLFRGTLKYNTLIAALQMVDSICNAAICMSDNEIAALGWYDFIEKLDGKNVPELITYLKERRLYVNEPVEYEEDA